MNNLFDISYINIEDRKMYNRLKEGQLCLYIVNDQHQKNTYYLRLNEYDSEDLIAAGHTKGRIGKIITGDVMLVFDATEGIEFTIENKRNLKRNLKLNSKSASYELAKLLGVDPTKPGKNKLLLSIEPLPQGDPSMHIFRVRKP